MDLSWPSWSFPDPSASPRLFYALGWVLLAADLVLSVGAVILGVVMIRGSILRWRKHKAWMAWVSRMSSVDEYDELVEEGEDEQQAEDNMPTLSESGEVSVYPTQLLPTQQKQFSDLVRRLREIADELAADGQEITSEDVWKVYGKVPLGVDPRIMGAVFDSKRWLKKGFKQSERRERHGAPIRIWQLRTPKQA